MCVGGYVSCIIYCFENAVVVREGRHKIATCCNMHCTESYDTLLGEWWQENTAYMHTWLSDDPHISMIWVKCLLLSMVDMSTLDVALLILKTWYLEMDAHEPFSRTLRLFKRPRLTEQKKWGEAQLSYFLIDSHKLQPLRFMDVFRRNCILKTVLAN